jgi:hypothetical protein
MINSNHRGESFMKKLFNLLLIAVMIISSTVIGVKAEGNEQNIDNDAVTGNTASQTVTPTVDEVPETTYGATITWGDMKYDWTYFDASSRYAWAPKETCQLRYYYVELFNEYAENSGTEVFNQYLTENPTEVETENANFWTNLQNDVDIDADKIYSDSTCETKATTFYNLAYDHAEAIGRGEGVTYRIPYYELAPSNRIKIVDNSVAGSIVPTFEWTSAAKYPWTTAYLNYYDKFTEDFLGSNPLDQSLPASSRVYMYDYGQHIGYRLSLELIALDSATASNATSSNAGASYTRYHKVSSNDTIGTLTIHLSAAE